MGDRYVFPARNVPCPHCLPTRLACLHSNMFALVLKARLRARLVQQFLSAVARTSLNSVRIPPVGPERPSIPSRPRWNTWPWLWLRLWPLYQHVLGMLLSCSYLMSLLGPLALFSSCFSPIFAWDIPLGYIPSLPQRQWADRRLCIANIHIIHLYML